MAPSITRLGVLLAAFGRLSIAARCPTLGVIVSSTPCGVGNPLELPGRTTRNYHRAWTTLPVVGALRHAILRYHRCGLDSASTDNDHDDTVHPRGRLLYKLGHRHW
ncbi:hypothetical protein GQ53DRAFT_772728 [Thozetella sp. PMI_491]|nr:hypothetical protein GQ53DRAFT_772728 [Thozetella sp. PMI_491]